ncbi:MAG: chitobiase/beta-hexosaminidase C-terminal domain-containing protein [Ruminiclostridium sp.]
MKFKALASALLAAAVITCSAAEPSVSAGVCVTAEASSAKISCKLKYTDNYTYLTITPINKSDTLRYTTDGTVPTKKSKEYTVTIRFTTGKTVRIAEFDENGNKINAIKVTVKRRCAEPEIEVLTTDSGKAKVSIATATSGADIYYTTDGSEPDTNSTLYKGSFTVETGAVVKAVACKKNWKNSEISSLAIAEAAKAEVKYDDFVMTMLAETNKMREENGLEPLEIDYSLCAAAEKRADEISADYSIKHNRPNGDKYYTVFAEVGFSYSFAAENIGYTKSKTVSAAKIVALWMDSPVHRANILSEKASYIGLGWEERNGVYYWVQLFGEKKQ